MNKYNSARDMLYYLSSKSSVTEVWVDQNLGHAVEVFCGFLISAFTTLKICPLKEQLRVL